MFAIRINNTFLDLEPKASLRYTLNNPLFDPNAFARSFNFPLTIPLTPRNRATLSWPERLDSNRATYEYEDATLFLMYVPFEVGRATITATDPGFAEIVLQNIESEFLDKLDDINIHEILDTINCRLNEPTPLWTFTLATPPFQYQMTIDGQQYFWNVTAPGGMAEVLAYFVEAINDDFPGMASSNVGLGQLYLDAELVNDHPVTFFDSGFTLTSILSAGESHLQGFLNYLDNVNNTPVASHCFPVLNWGGFYKGNNPKYTATANPWFSGNTMENQPYLTKQWETTFVPQVKLPYVMSKITDLLSLAIGGTFWNEVDVQRLIFLYNRAIDEVTEHQYYGERKWINHFSESFDLNRHVPEMTAREMFDAFIEFFQLYFKIEDNTLTFYEKAAQLTAEPLNWTGKIATPKQAPTEKDGYTLTYEKDTNDTAIGGTVGQLDPYIIGDGETKIRTKFRTAYFNVHSPTGFSPVKVPVIVQAGSSNEAGLGDNAFRPRFLFFHGLQPNASGVINYPFASHDNIAANGTTVGNRSLDWPDPATGLYAKSWAGVVELGQANTVTVQARLTVTDLLQIRKWEQARVRFYTPDGEITGIIKQVRIEASHKGLAPATVTIVKQH